MGAEGDRGGYGADLSSFARAPLPRAERAERRDDVSEVASRAVDPLGRSTLVLGGDTFTGLAFFDALGVRGLSRWAMRSPMVGRMSADDSAGSKSDSTAR